VKAAVLYRIAAGVLVLFGVLHTIGFLSFQPPTPEGIAVRDSMTNVHFHLDGTDLSYGSFYRGFGLFITVYLLFSALVAWQLARHPVPAIGWGLCAVQIVCIALGLIYFSAVQATFCAILAACVGWATWKSQAITRS
jgi:hypothetical protein